MSDAQSTVKVTTVKMNYRIIVKSDSPSQNRLCSSRLVFLQQVKKKKIKIFIEDFALKCSTEFVRNATKQTNIRDFTAFLD